MRRSNPFRAFGDAVYLSDHWTRDMPGDRQIQALLGRLRQHQFYQCYWDAGSIEPDGTIRFSPGADSFVCAAEPWCLRQKYPMKFKAWLRNHVDGQAVASLEDPHVIQNVCHYLGYYKMFDGVHFDVELNSVQSAEGFWHLVEAAQRQYSQFSFSVVGRLHWLRWEGFVEALATKLRDVEFPLFGSGLDGNDYLHWCEEQTGLLLSRVAPQHLILTVPAYHAPVDEYHDAESLPEAIRGIKLALGRKGVRMRLALYREGLANDDDWQGFLDQWVF
jgi:hypothetical protein